MMAGPGEIKGLMERDTEAMEALVPTTSVMTSLNRMHRGLTEQGEDINGLRQQLSLPAFPE
ncbi:hypothetical protein K3757_08185 [Sulfitobacter sp. S223]|uniref:hypothetical protein n=1 Tax=Sulfitobacter sp. S223 TaxID=2867023 RepID=UPI0021A7E4B8|nr:hypothetical protein [Sulfitobacter sp. S223]UWR27902.1 hypothetical protein K3757_08185 [Sulfitobacter sp. S223]